MKIATAIAQDIHLELPYEYNHQQFYGSSYFGTSSQEQFALRFNQTEYEVPILYEMLV